MNITINPIFTDTVVADRRRAFTREATHGRMRRLARRAAREREATRCHVLPYASRPVAAVTMPARAEVA